MGSLYKLVARGTDGLLHRLGDPIGLTTPIVSDDGTKPVWIEAPTDGSAAHIADTSDAHDASAISIADAGTYFTGTDVEAALQELGAAGSAGAIAVQEEDGTPNVSPVTTIKVTNGTLTDHGSGVISIDTSGGATVTDRNDIARDYSLIKNECYFQNITNVYEGGITAIASGTGAAISSFVAVADHPGIFQLSTGTTTTGSVSLQQNGTGKVFMPQAGLVLTCGMLANIPTLSNGSQGFRVSLGGLGALLFRYDLAATGANWQTVDFNSVAHDTGVAVDTGWHYFEIVLTGTTDCRFYIDGTLVRTETTIGTGAAEILAPASIAKAALGSTARTLLVDAYWYEFEFTSPR